RARLAAEPERLRDEAAADDPRLPTLRARGAGDSLRRVARGRPLEGPPRARPRAGGQRAGEPREREAHRVADAPGARAGPDGRPRGRRGLPGPPIALRGRRGPRAPTARRARTRALDPRAAAGPGPRVHALDPTARGARGHGRRPPSLRRRPGPPRVTLLDPGPSRAQHGASGTGQRALA